MTVSADRRSVKEGEPVTVTVTIAGEGNIKALPQPVLEETEDFKRYEPRDRVEISTLNDLITGTKTFEYLFIPLRAGNLKIPSFTFTFFDPGEERYRTLSGGEIPVTVTAARGGEGRRTVKGGTGSETAGTLRPIRTKSDLDNWNPEVYVRGARLWVVVIPPLLFLVVYVSRRAGGSGGRRKSAAAEAREALAETRAFMSEDNHRDFFARSSAVLHDYLLNISGLAKSRASREEILKRLAENRFPEKLMDRIARAFSTADVGKFSPAKYGRKEMEAFLGEVEDIIKKCEKVEHHR